MERADLSCLRGASHRAGTLVTLVRGEGHHRVLESEQPGPRDGGSFGESVREGLATEAQCTPVGQQE